MWNGWRSWRGCKPYEENVQKDNGRERMDNALKRDNGTGGM